MMIKLVYLINYVRAVNTYAQIGNNDGAIENTSSAADSICTVFAQLIIRGGVVEMCPVRSVIALENIQLFLALNQTRPSGNESKST